MNKYKFIILICLVSSIKLFGLDNQQSKELLDYIGFKSDFIISKFGEFSRYSKENCKSYLLSNSEFESVELCFEPKTDYLDHVSFHVNSNKNIEEVKSRVLLSDTSTIVAFRNNCFKYEMTYNLTSNRYLISIFNTTLNSLIIYDLSDFYDNLFDNYFAINNDNCLNHLNQLIDSVSNDKLMWKVGYGKIIDKIEGMPIERIINDSKLSITAKQFYLSSKDMDNGDESGSNCSNFLNFIDKEKPSKFTGFYLHILNFITYHADGALGEGLGFDLLNFIYNNPNAFIRYFSSNNDKRSKKLLKRYASCIAFDFINDEEPLKHKRWNKFTSSFKKRLGNKNLPLIAEFLDLMKSEIFYKP